MNKKTIFLLHGLFLHPFFMQSIKKYFEKLNYDVINYGYQSTKYDKNVLTNLLSLVKTLENQEVYFIGHSMGGVIIRGLFQEYHSRIKLKDTAIVTLGSPHYASQLGTFIENSFWGNFMGTAGKSGITSNHLLEDWNLNVPIGCIAGVYPTGLNVLFSKFHKKQGLSDGTVYLDEAVLKNCTDSITVNCQHTQMIYSKEIMNLCNYFIIHKKFRP